MDEVAPLNVIITWGRPSPFPFHIKGWYVKRYGHDNILITYVKRYGLREVRSKDPTNYMMTVEIKSG